jgi:small subunit ribosomal protein S17
MFHDESDACKVGDKVEIVACRPMSKAKKFKLERVIEACSTDCAV